MSDYLPTEVVSEILKRLPVKCLLQFRCVCKEWLSLISSPGFIAKHLSFTPSETNILVRHYSKTHSKEMYTVYHDESFNPENSTRISFPFHRKPKYYYRIVGYCNGVLCLSDDCFGLRESVILWNPSIKRAITVPKAKVVFEKYGAYCCALGFGFDAMRNDYKVVRVAYLLPEKNKAFRVPPKVEVFSVSLGRWRRVRGTEVEAVVPERLWSQAVIGGVVHWNAYTMRGDIPGETMYNVLLKFDLGSEEFSEFRLPDAVAFKPSTSILVGVIKGSLAVVFSDDYLANFEFDHKSTCDVWVMEEYGNADSWAHLFKIDLDVGWGMDQLVMGMRRCGDIIMSTRSGEIVFKNQENEVSSTGIFGTKYSSFVDEYVESLVLLGKGQEVRGIEPEEDYENEDGTVEKEEYNRKMAVFSHMMSLVFGL